MSWSSYWSLLPNRATYPAHLILFGLIVPIILGEGTRYEAPHRTTFSNIATDNIKIGIFVASTLQILHKICTTSHLITPTAEGITNKVK
jgi:hypothetical protein